MDHLHPAMSAALTAFVPAAQTKQHTPGPWVQIDQEIVQAKSLTANIVLSIATVCDCKDGALIAAAPDLLEALELCKGNISSLLASAHPKVYGEWLAVVSAAIDKATGAA